MPRTVPRTPKYRHLGELMDRLGHVPAWRVCLDPPPGTATKRDLVRLHAREDKLYELIDGTLLEKPMGAPEAFLALELVRYLQRHLDTNDVGFLYGADTLIEMLPKLVRGPDVSFVSWEKRPERTVPGEPISDLIPDLAIEILSPSNTKWEITLKLKEYFLAGVLLVWVIDPATRGAAVYTAPDRKTTIGPTDALGGGDVLPGFTLSLPTLFARLEKPAKKAKKPRKK